MQIIHRVSVASSAAVRKELAAFGITVPVDGLATFVVEEGECEAWPALRDWISSRKAVDIVTTKFSDKEILEADNLELVPDWHHGYPQPDEDNLGYRRKTYDLTEWCQVCGIGMKQRAPFQLKSEPKWGARSILQLNWVFDEYFVTPEIWSTVFQAHAVACRPVEDTRGRELKTVVQLVISEEVSVIDTNLPKECCRTCGREKLLPVARGPFPRLKKGPRVIAKTQQAFGSGQQADKRVIISTPLARALLASNVKGASVRPVQASS